MSARVHETFQVSIPAGNAPFARRNPVQRWLRTIRTLRMFEDDRPLALATLLLAVSALVPLTTTAFLPLVDLGSNMGAASLLDDAASGSGIVARYYEVNLGIVPYWTVYLLIALLGQFVGPMLAAKLVVGLVVVLLPIAGMRLLLALGRSPRLGLWLFMLTWDNNLYWGWITFQYGMVLGLFALAKLSEMRDLRHALWILPLTICIGLTHLHAVALLLTAGGLMALVRRPFWRGLSLHALALCGCLVPLVPWALARFGNTSHLAQAFTFDMPSLRDRITKLFSYTIDNLPAEGSTLTAAAFVLLLLGPICMTLLEQRNLSAWQRWTPLCIVLACAGLYCCLPFAISGPVYHWYTYPRFGTYLLVALLLVPRPVLRGLASLALVPGLLLSVWVHQGIAMQFSRYGKYVAPYERIIAAIPHGSRILPVDLDDYRFRGTREAVLGQLHAYAAAATASYDPHLFDEPNNPLRFRHEAMPPHHNWLRQSDFSMDDHGVYYDYVIVHPAGQDPIERRTRWRKQVELVRSAGPWRLYRVKAPRPFPALPPR